MEKLEKLTLAFNQDRDEHLAGLFGPERMLAAADYDRNLPMITQREQLISIGVKARDIEGNLEEVLHALNLIGVKVLKRNVPKEIIASTLDKALDDLVPCIWKCDGYCEVIDVDPRGEFLPKGVAELKALALSGAISLDSEVISMFE